MLYILHGDDTAKLRLRLSELIEDQGKATFLNGEKASSTEILTSLRSSDMFQDTKYVVIEKVLKLDKKTLEAILPEVNNTVTSKTLHLVLCHDSELSKVFLGKFTKAKVELFAFPKLFFTFLDNFTPHSLKRELDLLKMENIEAEQIFYALIKRVRQLYAMKTNPASNEIMKMSPWQIDKLRIQSSKFKIEDLEKIYKDLFNIEVKMKSGGLMLPLKKHLDILVIDELN